MNLSLKYKSYLKLFKNRKEKQFLEKNVRNELFGPSPSSFSRAAQHAAGHPGPAHLSLPLADVRDPSVIPVLQREEHGFLTDETLAKS